MVSLLLLYIIIYLGEITKGWWWECQCVNREQHHCLQEQRID
jgi:hypothetical protein